MEPVQVFSFSSVVKNAADIEMVVDVLEVAAGSHHVDVFVLVSGDGGFVPLVRRLHALGKYVMVATTRERAEQSTSKLLQAVADHFLVSGVLAPVLAEDADAPIVIGTESAPEQTSPNTLMDTPEPALAEVVEYIRELLYIAGTSTLADKWTDNEGRINGAALGLQIHSRWRGLTRRSLGYRTLGSLIEETLGLEVQRPPSVAVGPGQIEGALDLSSHPDPDDEEAATGLTLNGSGEAITTSMGWVGDQARSTLREEVRSIVSTPSFAQKVEASGGSLNRVRWGFF